MSSVRKLKELEFEFQNTEGNIETFIVREPTVEETNAADLIRSHAFFEAVDKGIRTETEILRRLREQGRFNEEDHSKECNNLGIDLRNILVDMAVCKNKEDLSKLHEKARKAREALMEKYRDKETFLQHSAEQKAENALHLALLGVCLEKKDGTPVFAVVKKDTQELDIEKTYYKIYNYENDNFIRTALQHFMPLSMGIDYESLQQHSEDTIFKERMNKLNGENEDTEVEIPDHADEKIPEAVYSPIKDTSKDTSLPAPARVKPDFSKDSYKVGVDLAKPSNVDQVDIKINEVPDFDVQEDTKVTEKPVTETVTPKEPQKAPIAPKFEEKEVQEIKSQEPINNSKPEEDVVRIDDSNTVRISSDSGSDGVARPYGVYNPPKDK